MRRSFSRYPHVLYIPLLAVGLIMVGCDDGSPGPGDGGNNEDSAITESFPAPSNGNGYAEETAINIQSSGLGIRLEGENPSSSTLTSIYDGSIGGDTPIQLLPSGVTASASTYGELTTVADVKSQIQNFSDPLLRSDSLEQGVDAPNASGKKTADELISFYLDQAQHTSENGVDFSQLSEKGVSSALTYADATDILRDFADDGSVSGDAEAKWNEAFGHFGAPRNFGVFLDLSADGGLSGGSFQDVVANHRGKVLTIGGIVLFLVLVGGFGSLFVKSGEEGSSPSDAESVEKAPTAEAGPSPSEASADSPAPAPEPSRRAPADIALGDTLYVTVRATADVRELRVQQDDNLRRPYWIEEGEARVFPFTERVTLQNRLDSLQLLLEGYRYPITSTDAEGRVIIRRDTAEQFADTLRGAPVSITATPDTIEGSGSTLDLDTTSSGPSDPES